jgi:hypothetical protein
MVIYRGRKPSRCKIWLHLGYMNRLLKLISQMHIYRNRWIWCKTNAEKGMHLGQVQLLHLFLNLVDSCHRWNQPMTHWFGGSIHQDAADTYFHRPHLSSAPPTPPRDVSSRQDSCAPVYKMQKWRILRRRSNSRRESRVHRAGGGSKARRAGERSGEVRGTGAVRCIWRRKQIGEMWAVRQLGEVFPGMAALMLVSWIYAYQLEKKWCKAKRLIRERSTALGSSDVWLHIGPC